MQPVIWMRVILLGAWISSIKGQEPPIHPAIAMVCGKATQHLDVDSGEWVTDPTRSRDCMSDPAEILQYCREVYPKLNITNVSKQSKGVTIQPWCSIGHTGRKCKGHGHTVAPVRCVVGTFVAPSFVVETGCSIDSLHDESLCKGQSYWKAKASERCKEKGLMISDEYSTMSPCDPPSRWHGIEFVCCRNTNKVPGKAAGSRVASNADPACLLPMKIGMCRAALDAWYFNSDLMRCDHFIYGGCGGNDNRFPSMEACREKCEATLPQTDELLSIPLIEHFKGLGPVISDKVVEDVVPATTVPPLVSQSQQNVAVTSYLDSAMDPDREHEMYMEGKMQQLGEHQRKISQATRQWDNAKTQLLRSGGSKEKLAQLDEDFHNTVTALTKEHNQKQDQLLSVHLARVDAHVVETRLAAYQDFKDELDAENPNPSRILRAFKRYIKSEHKDQLHITQHFNQAVEGGTTPAILPSLQNRLSAIQVRVHAAIKLVHGNPQVEAQILTEMNQFALAKIPPMTLNPDDSDVKDDVDTPIRIDDGGLAAENTDNREEVDEEEVDEGEIVELSDEEESDYYVSDDDDSYLSSDDPEPLNPHQFTDVIISDDFSKNEGLDTDDVVIDPARVYNIDDDDVIVVGESSYSERRWLRWLIVLGGGLIVAFLLIAIVKCLQVRRGRRQHFTKLEVEDHLTAEERQLLQMQQNGYENPTYKFFEKQQAA